MLTRSRSGSLVEIPKWIRKIAMKGESRPSTSTIDNDDDDDVDQNDDDDE